MLIFTTRLSKRKLLPAALAVLAAAGILLCVLCFSGRDADAAPEPLLSNTERIAYLSSWGWDVDPEPLETLQLLFPGTLPEDYKAYNELQQTQGLDLSRCCGKQVTRYTYTVTNYPGRPEGVQLNLYICEDQAAAGDVIATGEDGFQQGLAFPEEDA